MTPLSVEKQRHTLNGSDAEIGNRNRHPIPESGKGTNENFVQT